MIQELRLRWRRIRWVLGLLRSISLSTEQIRAQTTLFHWNRLDSERWYGIYNERTLQWETGPNGIWRLKSDQYPKCAVESSQTVASASQEKEMSRAVQIVYPRDMGPREWGEEILIAQGDGYIGKKLLMKAGKAGGLQYHREKEETFM